MNEHCIDAFSNEEKLNILAGARAVGFEYHTDASGRLVCTLDQLLAFSSNVASATAEQIIAAFKGISK